MFKMKDLLKIASVISSLRSKVEDIAYRKIYDGALAELASRIIDKHLSKLRDDIVNNIEAVIDLYFKDDEELNMIINELQRRKNE